MPTLPSPDGGRNPFPEKDIRPKKRHCLSGEQLARGRSIGTTKSAIVLLERSMLAIARRIDDHLERLLALLPAGNAGEIPSCVSWTQEYFCSRVCINTLLKSSLKREEKKENPPLRESSLRARRPPRILYDQEPAFLEFWSLYPRKDGSKAQALKLWLLHVQSQGLVETVLQALQAQIANNWREQIQERDLRHIPYPTTWLNGARWEAEILKPKLSLDEQMEARWAEEDRLEQERSRAHSELGREEIPDQREAERRNGHGLR